MSNHLNPRAVRPAGALIQSLRIQSAANPGFSRLRRVKIAAYPQVSFHSPRIETRTRSKPRELAALRVSRTGHLEVDLRRSIHPMKLAVLAIAVWSLATSLAHGASANPNGIAPPSDHAYPGEIRLAVDVADLERRIVHVHETLRPQDHGKRGADFLDARSGRRLRVSPANSTGRQVDRHRLRLPVAHEPQGRPH
jgi:hypothetical protein